MPSNDVNSTSGIRTIGQYRLSEEIASGGMATVHLGRLVGPEGFARIVAIKRLHPHLARNPDFVAGLLDEARLAARIHHPNVVSTLDVIATDGEVLLVMDYVEGETLARMLSAAAKRSTPPSPAIVSAIMGGALRGLHAAHEACSESGEPLHIVHRDVSPQNVVVGVDGLSRVLDFGIAKAANRVQQTKEGVLKGKVGYMSPEQARGRPLDRRSDVFSAGVVLWEALTASRLYPGTDAGAVIFHIVHDPIPELPPAIHTPAIAAVLRRSLAKEPDERFPTALEAAIALEKAIVPATPREVGEWLEQTAGEALAQRAEAVARVEADRTVEERAPSPTATATAPSPRRAAVGAALAVVLLVVIGVGGYAVGAKRSGTRPSTSEEASAASAPPAPSEKEASPAPIVSETATATATPLTTSKPKTSTASHGGGRAPSPTASSRASAAASNGSNCQSPTYFDEHGIKHVKPGCLR